MLRLSGVLTIAVAAATFLCADTARADCTNNCGFFAPTGTFPPCGSNPPNSSCCAPLATGNLGDCRITFGCYCDEWCELFGDCCANWQICRRRWDSSGRSR